MVVVLCYGVLHHAWLRVAMRCDALRCVRRLRRAAQGDVMHVLYCSSLYHLCAILSIGLVV